MIYYHKIKFHRINNKSYWKERKEKKKMYKIPRSSVYYNTNIKLFSKYDAENM